MERWSLGNRILPIGFRQFRTLGQEFRDACALSFGGDCTFTIRCMDSVPFFTASGDAEIQGVLRERNDRRLSTTLDRIEEVTESLWRASRYVCLTLSAEGEDAMGQLEFKGRFPREACYSVQPGRDDVRSTILHRHFLMSHGPGHRSHRIPSMLGHFSLSIPMPATIKPPKHG